MSDKADLILGELVIGELSLFSDWEQGSFCLSFLREIYVRLRAGRQVRGLGSFRSSDICIIFLRGFGLGFMFFFFLIFFAALSSLSCHLFRLTCMSIYSCMASEVGTISRDLSPGEISYVCFN